MLISWALEGKRLGLLNEIVPGTGPISVLMNPDYPDASLQLKGLQEAATVIKRELNIVYARTGRRNRCRFQDDHSTRSGRAAGH